MFKSIRELLKKNKNLYFYFLLFFISVIFVIFNSLGTVLYGFNNNDATIFNIVGKYWRQGYLPYINFFDHKGPIIFFINMLSWLLFNCEKGILFFQIISTFVSLIFLFKIADLKLENKGKSLLFVLLSLTYLIITYTGGNMTEEYCLPFLILCMYLNLKFFKNYCLNNTLEHKSIYSFIYGLSFAICFLTRLTNAVNICAGICIIAFLLLKNKNYKNFFINCVTFIIGFLVLTLPFTIYFYINNAFFEFIDATLLYNIKYASKSASWLYKSNLLSLILKFLFYFFPSYIMILLGIIKTNKKQKIIGSYYILIGVMDTLLLLSNRLFRHYGIIILANFLIFLLEVEKSQIKNLLKKKIYITSALIGVCCLAIFARSSIKNPSYSGEYNDFLSKLNENDKSSFIIWNGSVEAYEYYNIKPYYKYFATQEWHALFSDNISEDIHDTFYNGDVKWILFNGNLNDSIINDVITEKYEHYFSNNDIVLYRRKE